MAFASGKGQRVTVGGTPVPVTRSQVRFRHPFIETTNSESVAFETFIAGGISGADVELDLFFDTAVAYYNMVVVGSSVAVVMLPVAGTAATNFTGTVSVENVEVIGQVRDAWRIRVTGKANGAFTYAGL